MRQLTILLLLLISSICIELSATSLSSKPDNLFVFGNKKDLYIYIVVQGGNAPKDTKRRPLNLSVVLDRSGSMQGDKLKYVKQAASFLTDQLNADDRISIVTYETSVDVIQPPTKVTNKSLIKSKIAAITDAGSTNLSGGMQKGYSLVSTNFVKDNVNRVLLLSDGLANVGISDPNKLQEIARKKSREEGISISTFGVGADFDEKLMTGLSEHGSGGYYFIDSPDKLPQIFGTELKGLLSVVAQNAKLKINFPAGNLRLANVYGYPHQSNKGEISVDFKDVFANETKAILIKFGINDISSPLKIDTLLEFDDTESLKNQKQNSSITIESTSNEDQFKKAKDAEVEQNILLFETNEVIENATDDVDKQDYKEAKRKLKTSKTRLESVKRNAELERQYKVITDYEKKLENVESMGYEEKSIMQKGSRSDAYKLKKKR